MTRSQQEGFTRPSASTIARLAALPAACIGDAQERLGSVDSSIQAVWADAAIAGPAYTVWTRAGDNAGIHEALALALPGDVVVVAGEADVSRALLGELIGERAISLGIAGFAVDGAVRDASGLQSLGLPVFARAVTPAGPFKHGPFRLGVPIAFGGVAVLPGDIVVGDADGMVVIPAAQSEAVADAAEHVHENERQRREAILAERKAHA